MRDLEHIIWFFFCWFLVINLCHFLFWFSVFHYNNIVNSIIVIDPIFHIIWEIIQSFSKIVWIDVFLSGDNSSFCWNFRFHYWTHSSILRIESLDCLFFRTELVWNQNRIFQISEWLLQSFNYLFQIFSHNCWINIIKCNYFKVNKQKVNNNYIKIVVICFREQTINCKLINKNNVIVERLSSGWNCSTGLGGRASLWSVSPQNHMKAIDMFGKKKLFQ